MIIDRTFHNIQCDHCGALIDEETWWDDMEVLTSTILDGCGWIECEGGRHYCDECWTRDDDDNIVTKDGRKWDDDKHKEILTDKQRYQLDYLEDLLDPNLTLTQIRIEIIKAKFLFHSMVGWLYKKPLGNEIVQAMLLLDDRKATAPQWQIDCYNTFADSGLFYHLEQQGFPEKTTNIY